jgi:hypothetical protein
MEAAMTDPDLVFEFDPQNVQHVEEWIAARWPDATARKDSDGARLSWSFAEPTTDGFTGVVATESFLSMTADAVARVLDEARAVCEDETGEGDCYLLLATDGAQAVRALDA